MNLRPIDPNQIQRTAQVVLSVLDSDDTRIPGSLAEGVASGKSLLRGILQGQLFICEVDKTKPRESDVPVEVPVQVCDQETAPAESE